MDTSETIPVAFFDHCRTSTEEYFLGGGLDRGEDEGQEGERHERREVRSQRESVGVDEELDEASQGDQRERHAEARPYAPLVYGSAAGEEREGVPPVNKRHREQGTKQERWEAGAKDQVAGDQPRLGRLSSDLHLPPTRRLDPRAWS